MSGKEIFEENLKEWLKTIPKYMEYISARVEEARSEGDWEGFEGSTEEYLTDPANWDFECLDSEWPLEELEAVEDSFRPGELCMRFADEGHVEPEEVEKLKALGYEECNQYCFTPKDPDLGENYRIELCTSPVDDQFLSWGIIED